MFARFDGNRFAINKQSPLSTLQVAAASAVAAITPAQRPKQVEQAMANANASLSFEQKSQLKVVINNYSDVFSLHPENMGLTKLNLHKIDIN